MDTFSPDVLVTRAAKLLEGEGLAADHALTVACALVDADTRGHPSHGLSLLQLYVERIRTGGINAHARPRWIHESAAIAILDADAGPGQVGLALAAERCASLATKTGIAAVAVRNNNHVGMLAACREPFQRHGVFGLVSNISGPSVAPPGGTRATLGNNAFSAIVPRPGDEPFVIDCATGVVACGRIRQATALGEQIPPGWLIDRSGAVTTDPCQLDEGGAVPVFGEHKGLAVSLIVELLAGVLGGRTTSGQVTKQRQRLDTPMRCAQMCIGLQPLSFGVDSMGPFVDLLQHMVASGYSTVPQVYFPDQRESRHARLADTEGIRVAPAVRRLLGWSDRNEGVLTRNHRQRRGRGAAL